MLAESYLDIKRFLVKSLFRCLFILILVIPFINVKSAPADTGATILVTTTMDEFGTGPDCSLREAIHSAFGQGDFGGCVGSGSYASGADQDIITLPAGTYTLTRPPTNFGNGDGDLYIASPLIINGDGSKTTTIQAGTSSPVDGNICSDCIDRVLHIKVSSAYNVEINNVTIRYGKTADGVDGALTSDCMSRAGGGIYHESGTLTLNYCNVSNNRTGDAGDNCPLMLPQFGESAPGGGIFHYSGFLILNSTTIRANETGAGGDGVSGADGYPSGDGGGIYQFQFGTITMTNTFISSNTTGRGGTGGDAINANAGSGANGGAGGGIYSGGNLTINNSVIVGNTTGSGGFSGDVTSGDGDGGGGGDGGIGAGIYISGEPAMLSMHNSTVSDNDTGLPTRGGTGSGTGLDGSNGVKGRAGGICLDEDAIGTFTDCTINNNNGYQGGGIYIINAATLEMYTSTVYKNTSKVNGGGILVGTDSALEMHNSTISLNAAELHGGGLYTNVGGESSLSYSTIARNISDSDNDGIGDGGGIVSNGTGIITITNTIVAGNTDTGNEYPDCLGNVYSGDYNLLGISDGIVCAFTPHVYDQVGTEVSPIDPLLGMLTDNGGPTLTHSLVLSSPAVDYIPNSINGCAAGSYDQRGILRFPPCDIGAYEVDQSEYIYIPMISRD